MTYNSTVLADSPKLYYRYGETTGNFADTGSVGGTATATGASGITYAQGAAGTIDGTSAYFGPNGSYAAQTFDNTAFSACTVEFWYKRNTGYNLSTVPIFYLNNGGTGTYLGIQIGSTGAIFTGSSSTLGTTTTVAAVADGNWHHIVYSHSGSSGKLYVDGVLKASPSGVLGTTSSAMTAYIGAWSGAVQCSIDEPAVYSTALTQTQVSAHYSAGTAVPSVPVTVTPPYINLGSLAEATPVVMSGSTEVVPVATATLSMATAPVVHGGADITNVVPVATLSLDTATAPVVSASALATKTYLDTADRSGGTDGHTTTTTIPVWGQTANRKALFKFEPITDPIGGTVTAHFYADFVSGTSMSVVLYAITGAWSESDSVSPAVNGTGTAVTFVPGDNAFDVTSLVQKSGYNGIMLSTADYANNSNQMNVYARESATNKPYMTAGVLVDNSPKSITVTPPAATMSLGTATPVVTASSSDTVAVPAASLSVDVIAPGVSTSTNISNAVPAQTMTLSFPGGVPVNPDFSAAATVMTLALSTPDAGVSIAYPAIALVPAIDAGTLDTVPATINLTTNVLKAVPAMNLTIKWVGIYIAEADRYITKVSSTVDPFAKWFRMDEVSGSTVNDWAFNGGNDVDNGVLNGAFARLVDGPYLRKATRFNGVDTWIDPGVYSPIYLSAQNRNTLGDDHYGTIEFSIRTTATDGVIMAGGAVATPSNAFVQNYDNGFSLRLVGGQFYVYSTLSGVGYKYKVRATINDGEWHHIVLSQTTSDLKSGYDNGRSFVNVDGQRALTRTETWGRSSDLLPRSIMANKNVATGTVTDFLAGDMRDFIVRMNVGVDADTATKLYYEWSNATIVEPDVMSLGVSMVKPFSVKGNVKKMLAIYGLPAGYEGALNGNPVYDFQSALSGMAIPHFEYAYNGTRSAQPVYRASSTVTSSGYIPQQPVVFKMGDYLVYPVSITGDSAASVDGVLNGEYNDYPGHGSLVDDQTGDIRFVNLQDDLNNITDFDVVTVVNYPMPKQGVGNLNSNDGQLIQFMPGYGPGSFPDAAWQRTRNAFRDSLLEAAYTGTSLWMPEIEMAKHLGFISDYDVHDLGWYQGAGINVSTFGQNNNLGSGSKDNSDASNAIMTNLAGYWIDQKHLHGSARDYLLPIPATPDLMVPTHAFDYTSDYQANAYRRIVEVEAGLTDIPSWEFKEMINMVPTDGFDVRHEATAADVIDKTAGLMPGDRTMMSLYPQALLGGTSKVAPFQRSVMLSARPDGVAGKVIAREMTQFYGPAGHLLSNPYANNVVAFAAERGTVVRGRAIRGRAFGDFMDSDINRSGIEVETPEAKYIWDGQVQPYISSDWDSDSRRIHAVAVQVTQWKLRFNNDTGSFDSIQTVTSFFNYGGGPATLVRPSISMNGRGLKWLANASPDSADDVKAYSPAMNLTVTMPNVTSQQDRNLDIPVIGAMRLVLEVRDAANYRGNDAQEFALPMSLNLEMHGIGAVVAAPVVATLNLTMPNSLVDAGGDKIAVYLDNDRTATLFLKEDN
jgi:hypothetical protein